MNLVRLALLAALCWAGAPLSAQKRWHVHDKAQGANNGQSWANAFTDLHEALRAVKPGDSVWVAGGPYRPDGGGDRERSFELPSGARLFGGFAGGETQMAQRDWRQRTPTVLSGDVGVPGDSTDNSFTILFMANPDSGTVVDGFLFDHGCANYTGTDQVGLSRYKCGGAIYVDADDGWAYPDIQHCVFQYNYATSNGGAVYVYGDGVGSVAPRFLNCVFRFNQARLDGGAVYRRGGSWVERAPDLGGCLFLGNRAGRNGGGYYYLDSEREDSLQFDGCVFEDNRSTGTNSLGGALLLDFGRLNASIQVKVKRCSFVRNASSRDNFVTFNTTFLYSKGIVMDSCFFEDNGSEFFFNTIDGDNAFTNCIFHNVQKVDFPPVDKTRVNNNIFLGGKNKVYIGVASEGNFSNNLVENCRDITVSRKAIFDNNIVQGTPPNGGTLIDFNKPFPIRNCLFITNRLFPDNPLHTTQSLLVQNSILINQGDTLDFIGPSTNPDVLPVILEHCALIHYPCPSLSAVRCGPGNLIDPAPLFRDSAGGDFRLSPCSPLVDAGLNTAADTAGRDLAGGPRLTGTRVDIGPYEVGNFDWAIPPTARPACGNAPNGGLRLETANGCPPYAFSWLRDDGQTGTDTTRLGPGTYQLWLRDAKGQQLRDTLSIPAGQPLALAAQALPIRCGSAAGGTATVAVTGGTPPLRFRWSDGGTGNPRQDLSAGQYRVTVSDAGACADSVALDLEAIGGLPLLLGGSPISCHGLGDGRLSIAPFGGRQPFRYVWGDGLSADSARADLGPGVYGVTVRDQNGCSATHTFALSDPDPLQISAAAQDASGPNTADGSASVTGIKGGTPPFRYAWNNGASTETIAGLLPGTYTVTVRDHNGCSASQTLRVGFTIGTEAKPERFPTVLLVAPNPAKGTAHLSVRHTGAEPLANATIRLFDLAGRTLWETAAPDLDAQGTGTLPLDLGPLSAGAYWVCLFGANGAVLGRVLLMVV